MKQAILILTIVLGLSASLKAAVLGGTLTYEQTGDTSYIVHLTWYRDFETDFEPVVWFAAYTLDDLELIDTFASIETDRQTLVTGYPTCVGPIEWFNIERLDYSTPVTLPANPGGYLIVIMGHSRSSDISNVLLPGARGMTLYATIPGTLTNNAPKYTESPVWYACSDTPLVMDLSAYEPDGDELEYTLVAALDAYGPGDPFEEIAAPPPYVELDYLGALTPTEPFASATEIVLDPETGILTALPTTEGVYVITVMVKEKRLGVDIGEMRRDFILIVEDCIPVTPFVDIGDDIYACNALTVDFEYEIDEWAGYYWDMGDGTTIPWPIFSYTYDAFGDYTVSYIANYGTTCADTFQITVHLREQSDVLQTIGMDGMPENCFYDTVTLIGLEGYSAQWFNAATDELLGVGNPFTITNFQFELDATALYYDMDYCYQSDTLSTFFYPDNTPEVMLNQDNPQWILYINNAFDPYVATIQWYKDGTAIPGATDPQLPLTSCGDYFAEITDTYGCVFRNESEDYCNSDISDSDIPAYYFAPNPTDDHGILHLSGNEPVMLTLINALGQVIWHREESLLMPETYISLDVDAGLYFIQVSTRSHQESIPVIVR